MSWSWLLYLPGIGAGLLFGAMLATVGLCLTASAEIDAIETATVAE